MYGISPALMEEGLYEIVQQGANMLHLKYATGHGKWDAAWHFYLVPAN
jgi:hypothetical protein